MSMYVTVISIKREFFRPITPAATQQISLEYITVVDIKDISDMTNQFPRFRGLFAVIIKLVQRWLSRSGKFKKKVLYGTIRCAIRVVQATTDGSIRVSCSL